LCLLEEAEDRIWSSVYSREDEAFFLVCGRRKGGAAVKNRRKKESALKNMDDMDVILHAQVPRLMADWLREEARKHDRTISAQLRRLLRDWDEQCTAAGADRGVATGR
jgi:hypothetical protein